MLVIRGVNIYPSEVERVLLGHTSPSPDYLLVVDERAAQPQLLALGACARVIRTGWDRTGWAPDGLGRAGPAEVSPAEVSPAEADLELRLREVLGVRVGVRVLPGGALPRTEVGKAVRVVRWTGESQSPCSGISSARPPPGRSGQAD